MKKVYKIFLENLNIFLSLFIILIGGIFGGYMIASILLVLTFILKKKNITEFLLVMTLITFILADNFKGPLSFFQNLRFVIVMVNLIYLLKHNLLKNNYGNYMIPFAILSLIISIFFSPLGIQSYLRAIAFWLIPLIIFRLISISYKNNAQRTSELLVLIFTSYIGFNLVFYFFPILDLFLVGRFKGLAGNPNALGLIMMFMYGLLQLIQKRNETSLSDLLFLMLKISCLVLIILTGSRNALISVLTFAIFYKFLFNKRLFIISLLGLVFFYFMISSINFQQLILSLGLSDLLRLDSFGDASGRTEVWVVAWAEIKNSFWFGGGLLYDDYYIKEYVANYFGSTFPRQWAGIWNSYLSLLLDVGLVGTLVYLIFWIKIFKKSKFLNISLAFIVMCFLSGITESWMAASMNPFTPMMFMFWAIQSQPLVKQTNIIKI